MSGTVAIALIALVLVAAGAGVVWKLTQDRADASRVFDASVAPYLDKLQRGDFERAYNDHTHPDYRDAHSLDALREAYSALDDELGALKSWSLWRHRTTSHPSDGVVYVFEVTLSFESGERTVSYDVVETEQGGQIRSSGARVRPDVYDTSPR